MKRSAALAASAPQEGMGPYEVVVLLFSWKFCLLLYLHLSRILPSSAPAFLHHNSDSESLASQHPGVRRHYTIVYSFYERSTVEQPDINHHSSSSELRHLSTFPQWQEPQFLSPFSKHLVP
jgi:hypothetical protein